MNREVVNVTTLPIPAELAALLHAASGAHTRVQTQTTALLQSVRALWCHQASLFFVCVCVCSGGEELHSDCLAVVQAPTVQVDPQLTLPLDINNYLMTHYIRAIFRVNIKYTYSEHGGCTACTWIPLGKFIYCLCQQSCLNIYNLYVLQEPLFGMLTAPLENSLIRMDDEQKQGAVNTFSLVHVA